MKLIIGVSLSYLVIFVLVPKLSFSPSTAGREGTCLKLSCNLDLINCMSFSWIQRAPSLQLAWWQFNVGNETMHLHCNSPRVSCVAWGDIPWEAYQVEDSIEGTPIAWKQSTAVKKEPLKLLKPNTTQNLVEMVGSKSSTGLLSLSK